MTTPHPPESLDDLVRRARSARAALDAARHEFEAARQALRSVAETTQLPPDRQAEVDELLGGDEPPHHRARWRPAPS